MMEGRKRWVEVEFFSCKFLFSLLSFFFPFSLRFFLLLPVSPSVFFSLWPRQST
jgi:hypothetical protein